MKRRLVQAVRLAARQFVTAICIATQVGIGFITAAPRTLAGAPSDGKGQAHPPDTTQTPAVKVNRTVPKVEPPKARLEFSSKPTREEFFRARLFEEPLVPMGGEPTPLENAALATALLGYSQRTSPDDF